MKRLKLTSNILSEEIKKVGNEWKVYPKKPKKGQRTRKSLGSHKTYDDALAQLRAIEISKNESIVLNYSQFITEKKQKINPTYLTKDAAEMRDEIRKNAEKRDDDPTAYDTHPEGGWQADYSESGKRYKTKPSKYTKAFAKKYGNKS